MLIDKTLKMQSYVGSVNNVADPIVVLAQDIVNSSNTILTQDQANYRYEVIIEPRKKGDRLGAFDVFINRLEL